MTLGRHSAGKWADRAESALPEFQTATRRKTRTSEVARPYLDLKMTFTIVTASYNYGRYIGECLESVAMQMPEAGVSEERAGRPRSLEVEHLVMDACSTDDTAEVVARFPHAQFFQEPDKGMTDGINKGFRKAQGDWVMWLNADDRLKPGALAKVLEFAQAHPDADVIYGGWDYIDGDGKFIRRMKSTPFDKGVLIQQGCYIGSTACFYRRATTIAEGHLLDDRFGYCMDGEYYARLAHLGKRFMHIPGSILADFRLHDGSISQKSLGKQDMGNLLRLQRQLAEPRAIRRMYGIKPFKDENLSLVVDGVFYHIYRLKKALLRLVKR
jgi:glycosyltransferase involved in cell wall biosynthesis